ncbi:hypothetical protein BK133_10285 [Paenibacillus sp. FSL H8-0548]|nr:flagellar filament capping protein FliD [Paenibacillus sp. FSL H8-0548]OMF35829.1 hypothetical protein BK133_10285 [Paenibacillus sp. FSL H8-0548]
MANRISGLSSGIDYDTIIKQMMDARRIPMEKVQQQKQLLQWKRDDYRTLNNKILDFKNAAFDMTLQTGYLSKKVTSSNESIVTVTGTANANEGQYKFTVDKLASAGSLSTGKLSEGKLAQVSTLGELTDAAWTGETGFTIGGEKGTSTISIKATDTLEQFAAAVNSKSSVTGVKVTYDKKLDTMFFVSTATGDASNISLSMQDQKINDFLNLSGSTTSQGQVFEGDKAFTSSLSVINSELTGTKQFKMTVNGDEKTFDITNKTTIGQLINNINKEIGTASGATAYLSSEGKLAFNDPNKALDASGFSDDSSNALLTSLGLTSSTSVPKDFYSVKTTNGNDAEVTFNGVSGKYSSNTVAIGGMNFTLKKASPFEEVTVGVTQDVDAVYDTIKKFVDKYNELIEAVNTGIGQKRDRDYPPLTDAQKEDMTEKEIEKWETAAKAGTLANDPLLSNGLQSLRRALSDSLSGLPLGQLKSLSDIGISNTNISGSTISGSYDDKGKLYIDETKLKAALAEKPDEVMALFTTDAATSSGDGIATRLYDQASILFKQITEKAGTSTALENNYAMGKESLRYDEQIAAMTLRLENLEKRYYSQFTAMETYLDKMNSQSAWLSQQFST